MSNGGEFRTALFGGFNKEDVRGYLQELERNEEVTKSEYQREILGLKAKLQRAQEENDSFDPTVAQELETQKKENEELNRKIARLEAEKLQLIKAREEAAETAGTEKEEEYLEKLELQRKEEEELRQKLEELQAEKAALIQEKEKLLGELEAQKAVNIDVEKSRCLEEEIQQVKEKKEKYDNDFKAISQVFEDARLSARYIEDEARKKAEEILEAAKKESKEIIEGRKNQIDKELEDRGIRLMAAKYKIESYRKELNLTQQKIYNLYSDMGKLVEEMPQRLEQLWEGDERFRIVEKEADGQGEENA